jgi:predicted flap endonuclease-1-like 5' DNA nuclease
MNNIIIFLAQTKSGATIEILFLLLFVAIIGYGTSWFYIRSIYSKKLALVNSEKLALNDQIIGKTVTIRTLNNSLVQKVNEIESLQNKINSLKELPKDAVQETDDMSIKNDRTEKLLYEKDEALIDIAQRKHLLDYESFGTATESEKDDLKMISGIGPFIEERLHALDIYTFSQISKFTQKDIDTINDAIEYFSGRIERDEWVAQAKEIMHNKDKWTELLNRISEKKVDIFYNRIGTATKEEADDLTTISGIGGWIKEKLHMLDIYTFRQIGNFNEEDVRSVTLAIEYYPGRIEKDEWILQAQDLVRITGKKTELFQRISDRKGRIYYDRLGIAHKHDANNLTMIKGISLWIEERLNTLDIYTFEQISRLTSADIESITEILEISPGRINRDNWVSQAQGLLKTKLYPEVV